MGAGLQGLPSSVGARGSLTSGALFADRFRIERYIAQGGMGALYEVADLKAPSKPGGSGLALKVMTKVEADASAEERFRREAELAKSLIGPQFPKVMHYGVEGGAPFIVMELLEGETLAARLKRVGTLSPRECMLMMTQLATGLDLAHAIGIIHRDITPRNLFFSSAPDGAETLKILDFGIAKHTMSDQALTVPGMMVGSPHYVSPEQALGGEIDGRTDLWSSAVLLYEALVGRRPFEGDAAGALLLIMNGEPTPPTVLVQGLGSRADSFFARALAKKPDARFETALEMADAFAEVVRDIPERLLGTRLGTRQRIDSQGEVGSWRTPTGPRLARHHRTDPEEAPRPDPDDAVATSIVHTPASPKVPPAARPAPPPSRPSRPQMDAVMELLDQSRSEIAAAPVGVDIPVTSRSAGVPRPRKSDALSRRTIALALSAGVLVGIILALLFVRR